MSSTTRTDRLPLMDLPAVAERLGVNERHIRRLVAERRIPFLKWGHLLRFDPAEIEQWVALARVPTDVSCGPSMPHRAS
ncbi:MAG: helix-turn-helix domain-containing protein [Acidimicrobiales bacterium]